jgi:hypothetical protein
MDLHLAEAPQISSERDLTNITSCSPNCEISLDRLKSFFQTERQLLELPTLYLLAELVVLEHASK